MNWWGNWTCLATRRASPKKRWRFTRPTSARPGVKDIILEGSQLGLQVHESIGHPIELDRVLGTEANFAGMSFLTLDKLGTLQIRF